MNYNKLMENIIEEIKTEEDAKNYKLKENLYRKGFNYDNIKKEDL